jgi:alanine racemase
MIEIALDSLSHNYEELQRRLGKGARIIPALKANAYGHGAGAVARCLEQFNPLSLSTGSLEDALVIRESGVDLPILLFGGALPQGLPLLLEHGFTPTICTLEEDEVVSRVAVRPTEVYVKVDAGLGRLGVPLREAVNFISQVAMLKNVVVQGVYTHLSFYDLAGKEWARERLAEFDALLDSLEAANISVPVTQAVSSAGLLTGLESRANTVCPGSLLYGVSPVAPDLADMSPFRPVLKAIKSRLIHVRGRVGVLPLGVADGYLPVSPDSGAYCLMNGCRIPIRGVSLEHMVLDLSEGTEAHIGDEVVLLGRSGDEEITVYDLARWHDMHPIHVLVALDRKIPYQYTGSRATPQPGPSVDNVPKPAGVLPSDE